jgi:epoxyqueuosine reductase QueG
MRALTGHTMKSLIMREIRDYVKGYKRYYKTKTNWENPLVEFADAKDPLFAELKNAVSTEHLSPADLMEDAETVIAYFIPFTVEIARSNERGEMVSEEWISAYIETNKLIKDINDYLYRKLEEFNYSSIVLPPTHNFNKKTLTSSWSHKHIGYIAGLGKFGLHQMLITERGCCGRLGSIVTNASSAPTKRPEGEFCLYHHNKSCEECIKKCITGAMKKDQFNKTKCYERLLLNAEIYSQEKLADVCGKCICVVPCSFTNPVRKK